MIVYLISSYKGINTGRGGHYYSLLQMAEEISKKTDILIISIGNIKPALYSNIKYAHHIDTSLIKMPFLVKKISILIKENKKKEIKAIHGYDEFTVYLLKKLSKIFNCEMILTKCGGITKKSIPNVPKLIVFHAKDFDFYKKNSNISKIYQIANRVNPTAYNPSRKNQINKIYDEKYFNIVKIGRIGKYYYKTLIQAINLAGVISKTKKTRLILIGHLESTLILNKLEEYAIKKNISLNIFSQPEYTINAAELIWGANLVVGTGRGAMEALSAEKLLFFPVNGQDLPCFFDINTAPYAMENNFSERTIIPESFSNYFSQETILNLIEDKESINKKTIFGKKIFDNNFSIISGSQYLWEIYNDNKNKIKLDYFFDIKTLTKLILISIKIFVKKIITIFSFIKTK